MKLTKNFNSEEFKCPCCNRTIDSLAFRLFVAKLQEARDIAGIPFVVNSGYRCAKHNKAVGGKPNSSHLKGVAADISARTSSARFRIVDALLKAGFRRIGIGESFVHVDMDAEKVQSVMWTYY